MTLYFYFTEAAAKSPPTSYLSDYTVNFSNSPIEFLFSTQKKGTLQTVEFLAVGVFYFRLFFDLSLKQSHIIISAGIPRRNSSHQLNGRNAT